MAVFLAVYKRAEMNEGITSPLAGDEKIAQEQGYEDSLEKRYLYKLSTNFLGLGVNLVTQAIIPRGLGPKAYGDFCFLSNFFVEMVGFFDMGTSTGFYTKLSQRPKESNMVLFYFYFFGIASLLIIACVAFARSISIHTHIWPAQEPRYIYFAAAWGVIYWAAQILSQMADAYGLTVPGERIRIFQKFLGMVSIVFLYYISWITLTSFFLYQYFLMLLGGGLLVRAMRGGGYSLGSVMRLSAEQSKKYLLEFYLYSQPLFIYSLIGLATGILDRWLLQRYSGSVQQGFYGLSYQIGAICFLFTNAMVPLLWREFSIAFYRNDIPQMAILFRRYVPLLYSIAAFFSCFIALQADKVIKLLGGSKYEGAVMAVTIMAFYPIHQTYGQLSSSIFFAAGQTKIYRNIGVLFMLIGLPLTFFLIAPGGRWGGMNAGAAGLAVKMVTINFIAANVKLFFNIRLLKLSFWKYLAHQLFSIGCLTLIAALATFGTDSVIGGYCGDIVRLIISGILYALTVIIVTYFRPELFGLRKQDVRNAVQELIIRKASVIKE